MSMQQADQKRPSRGRVTEEVLRAIPGWVAGGASREEIAEALGVKVKSLEAICSTRGVRLSPSAEQVSLERRLGEARWKEIRRHADRRQVPVFQLVVQILTAAVDGKLIDAVLDDGVDEA